MSTFAISTISEARSTISLHGTEVKVFVKAPRTMLNSLDKRFTIVGPNGKCDWYPQRATVYSGGVKHDAPTWDALSGDGRTTIVKAAREALETLIVGFTIGGQDAPKDDAPEATIMVLKGVTADEDKFTDPMYANGNDPLTRTLKDSDVPATIDRWIALGRTITSLTIR